MGFADHFGEKVPVPTGKREMGLMRDASYGVSSHFPSCGSKSQPAGLIREGILPPLALGVGADLMACGLADIDVGVTLEMARVNLGAHGYTPRSGHGG